MGLGMTLTEYRLTEQGIDRLRWLVTALLMVAATYSVIQLSKQLWTFAVEPAEIEHFQPSLAANHQSNELSKKYRRYQEHLPYQLFGEYVPPKPKIEELPVTELDIQLLAIMYSTEEKGSAVMVRSAGESGLYYQGDKLPNGVEIRAILTNQITLSRQNKVERLVMDDMKGEHYAGMFNASETLGSSMGGNAAKPPVYDPGDQSDELRDELEALRDMLNSPS